MSADASAPEVRSGAVSAAIDLYRKQLANDSKDFTLALVALAKYNAKHTDSFNLPSPPDTAALEALSRWRRDAQHAQARVRAVAANSPGRQLAVRWLKALISALDLQRQALSIVDPALAADTASRARRKIDESTRLERRLERALA
jgi:hypothetical protein